MSHSVQVQTTHCLEVFIFIIATLVIDNIFKADKEFDKSVRWPTRCKLMRWHGFLQCHVQQKHLAEYICTAYFSTRGGNLVLQDTHTNLTLYILVQVCPKSKQPFSWAKDCEQFCYRSEDRFRGFPRTIFTAIDQLTDDGNCKSDLHSSEELANPIASALAKMM